MSTADLSHLPPVSSLPSGLAQPPGRRGRRWSFDAALPLFTSTVKHAAPKTGRSRSRSVVGPESIFVPPTLTEKHEGFLQKNWRKLQKRRNSFSSANKDFIIVADCEDDSTHVLSGGDGRTVRDVLNSARHMELRINSYRVIMSSSRSSLPSFTASMSMSESLEDLFEELQDDDSKEHLLATDGRYATLHNLLEGERIYQQNLRTIFDTYAEPLRKFSALNKDDHRALFSGVEPLLSLSIMLSSKLEDALRQWDPGTAYLSGFFSKKFWEQYEEYVNSYPLTADYLREKRTNDDSFSEFCELRRGTSGQSLEELLYLPVRRLPRYEQQLRELREETDPAHPDYDDLTRAINKVKEMVVEHDMIVDGGVESIQGRFPYDDLHLTQRDSPAVSTLQRRRRSAPSAFLLKTLGSSRSRSAGNLLSTSGTPFRKEDFIQAARLTSGRYFIKEGPVQLTSQGVQAQDRYLFLFNDVLLIAKPKSGSTYKLKQRVRVCELWTAGCVEEVCESPRFLQQSFVLGWPITNQVVTCHTQQDKHTWLQSLNSQIEEERKKVEQRSVTVTVNGGEELEQMKEIDINIRQDAKELLKMYVDKCQVSESESKDFQLWVMPGREDTAFPLIGHEIPYSICCHGDEGETEPTQFRFFVKNKKASKRQGLDEGRKQKGKTFLSLFKRSSRDSMETCPPLKLFGQPLEAVMVEDELPKPVMTLLSMLCLHGPHTHGILRKSANEKLKKELRQRLDDGEDCITNDTSLHIIGALVKDYLRSLPESVLQDDLYDEWTATEQITDTAERVTALKQLCQQLPTCNLVLLRHVMCVLYHIERHSEWSSMDASNLATCVAQSMLRSKGTGTLQPSAVMKANNLLQFMIENCVEIFGEETALLLECAEEKPDSGTDTDSIPETNGNLRRDDSSLDSLEKDDPQDMESGSRRAKSHLSPVNLSNDSGVTLSDNQLVSDESHYNDNMRSHNLRHHRNSHNYVSKRHSADSLCSVEESSETEEQSEHFKHCSYRAIMKSTSGDHLYPTSRDSHSTEALSDSEIQTTRPRDRLMRQSSVISSTPPLSPQPKLSYSSDSLLSDSSASYLRENSGFSGDSPRHCFHPDQHYGQTFSQTITVNHEGSKQMLEKSNSDNTVPVSRHRPPQRRYSDESINYHVSPPSSPKTGRQQRGSSPPSPIHHSTSPSNSPKNNTHRHSVHSYLPPQDMHVPKGYESNESHVPKPSLSLVEFSSEDSTDGPENRSSRKPVDHHLLSQTRPPRILLQTYCQRRSSEQEAQQLPLSSSHSSSQDSNKMEIDSVNQHKSQDNKEQMPLYESRTVSVTRKKHNVIKIKSTSATPKPTPTPVQPQYLSQVTVRTRPEHPPSYQEALDRKERISKGLPVDVSLQDTLSQKRASAHAKQLYEQSLKQFINDAPNSTIKTSFSSSSTSSEEDFLPEKDPKKVYEESMRRFLEQQQSSTCASESRVSNEVSSKSTRSNSVGIVGSQGQTYIGVGGSQVEKHVCGLGNQKQTRVTIGGDSQRYRSHNFPAMPDHRTVIHIPSVRDSKLVEMRNRGLTSVSNSYSRTSRPGTHNPASGYFYNPKPRSSVEGSTKSNFSSSGGGSRISVNPRQPPSESSKTYHSTSDLSELSQQNKPGLSWSVADLRRNYQNPRSDPSHARPKSTHIVTVGGHDYDGSNKRPPPPPYNPPPPFRRNSDTARQSSSSSSSRGSTDGSGSSTSHTIRNNYSPQ